MRPYRILPEDLDRWGTLPVTSTIDPGSITEEQRRAIEEINAKFCNEATTWAAAHPDVLKQARALKPDIDNMSEFTDGYIFSNRARENTLEGDAPIVILKADSRVISLEEYRQIVECDTEVFSCLIPPDTAE